MRESEKEQVKLDTDESVRDKKKTRRAKGRFLTGGKRRYNQEIRLSCFNLYI